MGKMINITIELRDNEEILDFENWIRYYVKVVDFIIFSDTKDLYENSAHFRALTRAYYDAKKLRNDYINEHNFTEDKPND